ncbi:MAG: GTPase RsgA [Clostridia bacterium]
MIHTSAYLKEGIAELRQLSREARSRSLQALPAPANHLCSMQRIALVASRAGQLSEKVQRGRNTTRHAKLIPLDSGNGFVADTPGFTSLHLEHIPYPDLGQYYPEFLPWLGDCRFTGCSQYQRTGLRRETRRSEGARFQRSAMTAIRNYIRRYGVSRRKQPIGNKSKKPLIMTAHEELGGK